MELYLLHVRDCFILQLYSLQEYI